MASIASKDILTQADLIYGRMPEAKNEVVVDKLILSKLVSTSGFHQARMAGITDISQFINRKLSPGSPYDNDSNNSLIKLEDFIIVGISDLTSPCVYMDTGNFINLVANVKEGNTDERGNVIHNMDVANTNGNLGKKIYDIALAGDRIQLSKGRMPKNDYEIIVNASNSYEMKLNKTIDDKINENKLKVVGYYKSKEEINDFFTTANTIKIKVLSEKII